MGLQCKAQRDALSILAPKRYPWRFNSPKHSRHSITTRHFIPLNYISNKIEGVTLFNPWPPQHFDLIHAFNRIPAMGTPFVIGFESHLPRGFGIENSSLYRYMVQRLASPDCRAIIAISEYARRTFLHAHRDSEYLATLKDKLLVRLPNVSIEDTPDEFDGGLSGNVRLVFVGNHFGRKGGCVAVRMAELSLERSLPLQVDIVSSFDVGAVSWTDPLGAGYFDEYRLKVSLPNINYSGSLPNNEVLRLIRQAHFVVLATFSDTFGYSAIEAMANNVPVIATRQGALPEFISDDQNGILLDLDTDGLGEWSHINDDRRSAEFALLHRSEINRLANAALDRIFDITSNRKRYLSMRRAAGTTARKLFASDDADIFWDDCYQRAAMGVVTDDK